MKEPKKPKRAVPAYAYFCAEMGKKKEFKDMPFKERAKKQGDMWGELSKAKKAKYEKMAEKDKKRSEKERKKYNEDMKKYKAYLKTQDGSGDESDSEVEEKPKPKKKRKATKTGYMLFGAAQRKTKDIKDMKVVEQMKEIGKRWREMDDKEKDKWNKKAKK